MTAGRIEMAQDTVRQRVRDFLEPHFANHEVRDDEDIFLLGYVNSLFAMQLLAFVEREFALTIEPADLEIENFRSVDAVTELVESKEVTVR
jgi:acyl carrier protein